MDGYKGMVLQVIDLVLFAFALIKETYAAILPEDLGKAVQYAWLSLTGLGGWIGYVVAAGFYFGSEAGFGDQICKYSGIAYGYTDTFHKLLDFAN